MKISAISVSNFRGISSLEATNLGDTIIVAGQNGSGKSCIFDAIRLVKSVYGGYQQNEWQHFFNEFQIQLHGGSKYMAGLFNNASRPVTIDISFNLRDRERQFISSNAAELLEETIWQSVLPEAFQYGGYHKAMFSAQFRERQPEVTARVERELPMLRKGLAESNFSGRVIIQPNGTIIITPSPVLSVVFTNYRPSEIGVIDFHGAQRHYGREIVQGINLNLDQINQTRSQSTLYNYNAKYNNVKSEMAGNYIKQILAEKAVGSSGSEVNSLSNAMKELFVSFFPEKEFLGPQPLADGTLSFPVKTPNGSTHDLDELSSGEKEILYGYLRIRSSAPRDSIILLDEPELHLNPRLIRGLPEFYRRHLGEALQNQLWLVTHSDALIREAVGKPGFNVFHMLPCGTEAPDSSQLRPLTATKDIDAVMTDLVGDLAAYRPGGKAVIFEGGGDSDFDKTLTATLFSEELRGINLISGSNKTKVKALHEVLVRAHQNGDLPTKFYAIVDRDSDEESVETAAIVEFRWNVYHIENYLLDMKYIADAVNAFRLHKPISADEVHQKLESCARAVVPAILVQRLRSAANALLVKSINLGFNPDTLTPSNDLRQAIDRSFERLRGVYDTQVTTDRLLEIENSIRIELQSSFSDGSWIQKLPGREILKRFVSTEEIPTNYESFRNLVVSGMATDGYKPLGMKSIIDKIKLD